MAAVVVTAEGRADPQTFSRLVYTAKPIASSATVRSSPGQVNAHVSVLSAAVALSVWQPRPPSSWRGALREVSSSGDESLLGSNRTTDSVCVCVCLCVCLYSARVFSQRLATSRVCVCVCVCVYIPAISWCHPTQPHPCVVAGGARHLSRPHSARAALCRRMGGLVCLCARKASGADRCGAQRPAIRPAPSSCALRLVQACL